MHPFYLYLETTDNICHHNIIVGYVYSIMGMADAFDEQRSNDMKCGKKHGKGKKK